MRLSPTHAVVSVVPCEQQQASTPKQQRDCLALVAEAACVAILQKLRKACVHLQDSM
jgi:hypothetical protein